MKVDFCLNFSLVLRITASFSFLFHLGLIPKIYVDKNTVNFIEVLKFINTQLFIVFSCNLKYIYLLSGNNKNIF